MNKRFMFLALLAFALIFCLSITGAHAYDYGKSKGSYCDKSRGGSWSLETKFYYKAHLIYENKDELDLSEEQVEKIKALKIDTKKDVIKKEAEIEIIALDIKAEMWQDTINTEELNKLIDKKYDLEKEKAKSLAAAYAALKNTLTKEQREELKSLLKKCKKGKE